MVWASATAAGATPLFCVLVPHFKDEYWLSVGYGLEQEAERQNVDLLFYEAGGYEARAEQIEQMEQCHRRGVDAILIGAVTSDHLDLTGSIAMVAQDIPVFALVNDLHSDALRGRIGVDWREMGYAIGQELRDRHPSGSAPQAAVLVTGPQAAGWTGPLQDGLRNALEGSSVEIVEIYGGDTGLREQLALVETAMTDHPSVDYLIGSAPAVEAAIGVFAAGNDNFVPHLLSTYISHTVLRGLMNGSVLGAPYDDPTQQGVAAIQLAVSPDDRVAGPAVTLLRRESDALLEVHVSPADYFPDVQ